MFDHQNHVKSMLFSAIKYSLYFFIPVLYINTIKEIKTTLLFISFIAVIGCISVFLVSIGILELERTRLSPSRLSIIGIPKATGLISNYGDLAIVSSIAILTTFIAKDIMADITAKTYALVIYIAILFGYLGAQSRSMVLSVIASIIVYWYVGRQQNNATSAIFLNTFFVIMGIGTVLSVLLLYGGYITDSLATWGGRQAAITADDRLQQYAYSLKIIKSSPLVGDGKQVIESGIIIHNLWLSTLAQGGLISGIAVFLLFVIAFYANHQKQTSNILKKISALSAGAVVSIFIAGEFYGGFTYIFLFSLGVATVSTSVMRKVVVID
ncbi:MAG: O-antigen ligase family protein [Candidatus Thiodiazotropha sp.]